MFQLDIFIAIAMIYLIIIVATLLRKIIFRKTIMSHKNSISIFPIPFGAILLFATILMFCVYVIIFILRVSLLENNIFFTFMLVLGGGFLMIPGTLMIPFFINSQFILTDNKIIEYTAL